MSTITETVREQMTTAWKAGDTDRRDALRLLLSSFKNAEIDAGHALDDAEATRVLQKEAKQRRDSITEYEKHGRQDLADKEHVELVIIEEFLPKQLSDEEIRALAVGVIAEVGASGPSDVGKVMRPLLEQVAGRADGGRVNKVAREILEG
ncbi:MAG: GatB/YqeY domain-containing protein [Dehalococcoidia bacterium]